MTMAVSPAPGLRRIEHVMGMPVIVDVRDDGVDHFQVTMKLGFRLEDEA